MESLATPISPPPRVQAWPFPIDDRPPSTVDGAQYLQVDLIDASPTNPRKTFEEQPLAELADSIRRYGVLQPVLVRPHPKVAGRFELVAGERRWRASKLANQVVIPAIVRKISDLEALELQVIENLQREDVHPLEEAEGYEQLQGICRILESMGPSGRVNAESLRRIVGERDAEIAALRETLQEIAQMGPRRSLVEAREIAAAALAQGKEADHGRD